jgi:hypothetical protein
LGDVARGSFQNIESFRWDIEYPDGAEYAKYLHMMFRKDETTAEETYFNQSDHDI